MKIFISILGLCLIIAAQALINIFVFDRDSSLIIPSMPIWALIYIFYLKTISTKYLKQVSCIIFIALFLK